MNELKDKWILVTGASSGIGMAVTQHLLENATANVVAIGRNVNKMDELYARYGNRCKVVAYDLSDLLHISTIFEQLQGVKLDGMVHCAGLSPLMKIEDNDVQTMLDTYTINVLSFIELVKYFSKEEYSNNESGIVTMSSIAASVASYRQSVYSSSKSALEQFVKCAAKELLPRKIRVNAIAAGAVETDMLKELEKQSEGLREKFEKYYPMGLINPSELAKMVTWLLLKDTSHIDGTILRIDSGFFVNK